MHKISQKLVPGNKCNKHETLTHCLKWSKSVVDNFFGNLTHFTGNFGLSNISHNGHYYAIAAHYFSGKKQQAIYTLYAQQRTRWRSVLLEITKLELTERGDSLSSHWH